MGNPPKKRPGKYRGPSEDELSRVNENLLAEPNANRPWQALRGFAVESAPFPGMAVYVVRLDEDAYRKNRDAFFSLDLTPEDLDIVMKNKGVGLLLEWFNERKWEKLQDIRFAIADGVEDLIDPRLNEDPREAAKQQRLIGVTFVCDESGRVTGQKDRPLAPLTREDRYPVVFRQGSKDNISVRAWGDVPALLERLVKLNIIHADVAKQAQTQYEDCLAASPELALMKDVTPRMKSLPPHAGGAER